MTEYQDPGLTMTGKSLHLINEAMDYSRTVETVSLAEAWQRAEAANRVSDSRTTVVVLLTRNEGQTYYNGPDDPKAVVPPGHARIETMRMTTAQPSQRKRV